MVEVTIERIVNHEYCGDRSKDSEFVYPDEITMWFHSVYLKGWVPDKAWKILSNHDNNRVRYWVVCHPQCPISVLKERSKDDDVDVHCRAERILNARGELI